MRSLIAFIKKECTQQLRTYKVLILGLIFIFLGFMNPAVAKLTPLLLEAMGDALAESGMIITSAEVTALDSWVQFYKNLPMGLIAFVLLEAGIFTKEYKSGTLILSLTKGLKRYKVVVAKTLVLTLLWTLCYWLHFGITYACNAILWDNSIAQHLLFSAVCWWIFGIMVIALLVLFSIITRSYGLVLLGTGGVVFANYIISIIPKLGKYLPAFLANGSALIYGKIEKEEFLPSLLIAIAVSCVCFVISLPMFNKKQL
jgi:ABC-2 type transport system permease protein